MKIRLAFLLCLACAVAARADEPVAVAPPVLDGSRLNPAQLEQLLGPIALYPDALIALILPAATAPAEIVLAARYLREGGDPAAASGSSTWDESVQSLLHYAPVLKWMDDNLAWTKQLGEAFRDQPAEVMQAIQRLRARARAAGTLVDSTQQSVQTDDGSILILPTQADVLYIPYYDPAIIYSPAQGYTGADGFIAFSAPFAVGPWLAFDCDWPHHRVWATSHNGPPSNPRDWRHPFFPGQPGYVPDPDRHPWQPTRTLPPRSPGDPDRRGDVPGRAPINSAPDNRTIHRPESGAPPARNDTPPRDSDRTGPAPVPVATKSIPINFPASARTVPALNPPIIAPVSQSPVTSLPPPRTPSTPAPAGPPAQSGDDRRHGSSEGDPKKQPN